MNVNSFYARSLSERIELINHFGEYLCRIRQHGYYINLYTCDRIFVEVYYNKSSDTIAEIEILDPKDERLNLYAVLVNLADIYTSKP